jgi:hypothetical protein
MPGQLTTNEVAIVPTLKEAFESGRSVTLNIPEHDKPVTGCVSHIFETGGFEGYIFSAFVGDFRILVTETESAERIKSFPRPSRSRSVAEFS